MRLPTNPKIKGTLKELGEEWEQLLSESSLHKLLYSLIIIDELVKNEVGWMQLFYENGGL